MKRIIKCDEKWIIYNSIKRKRPRGKCDEPLSFSPKACLYSKEMMFWIGCNWKSILYYELVPDRLNHSVVEQCQELANRKGVVRTTQNRVFLGRIDRNMCCLGEMTCFTHHTQLNLHLQITIYSNPCKILLMEKKTLL